MAENITEVVSRHLHTFFGARSNQQNESTSASVTFLGLEPIEIFRFSSDDDPLVHYVSIGCSRHPMSDPTTMVTDPQQGPRAELVLSLYSRATSILGLQRAMAIVAAAPAVEGIIFTHDALLDLGEPLWAGSPFTAVLLENSEIEQVELLPPCNPVQFFRIVPLTATEAAWIRLRGAQALRDAWAEADIDVRDPHRAQAKL
ncbi:MAG: suppressor of fused domain protein [Mycobacteriaceae bacterium]